MKALREDFERWYVTASFEEKVSYAMLGLMGLGYSLIGIGAVLSALRGGQHD